MPTSTMPDPPIVRTSAGLVIGAAHRHGSAYLSIPFAAPPVGLLRFQEPRRPQQWDGVRLCRRYGPTPQRRPFSSETTVPEPSISGDDTLSVSVFTPAAGDREAGLPVLVWIHGGAYFAGSPASPWYDGHAFSRDGVVTVVISYRLGFDGYGWIDGAPLNRGVRDQIAALEWVQENIRNFGGDPDRVTIAGQSAGAGGALTLMASPRARGLFQGVISQSGAVGALAPQAAEEVGREFARALGIPPTLEAWRRITEDQILDGQGDVNVAPGALSPTADPAGLIELLRRDPSSGLHFAFAPVDDADVVVPVAGAIGTGRTAGVRLLIGATTNEVTGEDPDAPGLAEIETALQASGVDQREILHYRQEVERLGGTRFAYAQLITSYRFRAQARQFAVLRQEAGEGHATWLYNFVHRSDVTGSAGHCDELPFVWDLLDADGVERELGSPPQALATRMHGDWVGFISRGDVPWESVDSTGFGAWSYGGEVGIDADAYRFEAQLIGEDRADRPW